MQAKIQINGKRIKQAVFESGLSQHKFAKQIGVKQSQLSQWITGKRNIGIRSLRRIMSATGKSFEFFTQDEIDINREISEIK
jgi:transcriptional regulator with XRE-family HTH domain